MGHDPPQELVGVTGRRSRAIASLALMTVLVFQAGCSGDDDAGDSSAASSSTPNPSTTSTLLGSELSSQAPDGTSLRHGEGFDNLEGDAVLATALTAEQADVCSLDTTTSGRATTGWLTPFGLTAVYVAGATSTWCAATWDGQTWAQCAVGSGQSDLSEDTLEHSGRGLSFCSSSDGESLATMWVDPPADAKFLAVLVAQAGWLIYEVADGPIPIVVPSPPSDRATATVKLFDDAHSLLGELELEGVVAG
jgi:hypothetical protein